MSHSYNNEDISACEGRCDARHIRDLEALADIARLLNSKGEQSPALIEVLAYLEQRRCMTHATIMLLTPDGNELVLEAHGSDDADGTARYRRGEGVIGQVLEAGETVIVPKVSSEPRFQYRIHSRATPTEREVSFICVPIRLENEVIGTFSADHATHADPLRIREQVQMMEIIASMVANDAGARRMAKIEREVLQNENQRLIHELEDKFRPANMTGESAEMRAVFARVHQVAAADTTVLIRGESGTGKELIAAAIHYNSPRKNKPFIKVNCSALTETLLESELFGHEKGAFTGALYKRAGRLEEAECGTLFLDEMGDFSPAVQVKLLRVIQEREYERVGSSRTIRADVRIVAATNRDLEKAVREERFREDLYYRINVFPIVLPPLRDRRSDIMPLANAFIEKYARRMDRPVRRISTSAISMLMSYHWPGNVRELENCIEHAMLLCTDGVIHGRHLPPALQSPTMAERPAAGTLRNQIELLERDMIIDALKRQQGNVTAAARELGITGRMVRYKIEKLGVDYDRYFKKSRKAGKD
jgi:Nif-specific regulatory protein